MIKNAKAHGSRYNMQTVSGDALTADLVGNDLWIYDESGPAGEVEIANVMQSNGIMHSVGKVLLPK